MLADAGDTLTGGLVIPATWVHDAVVKAGYVYFAAESSSGSGGLFRLDNETTATRLGRFPAPCLSFGHVNDSLFVGLAGGGRILKSTSGGVSWDTCFRPAGVANTYRIVNGPDSVLWILTGDSYGVIFAANYKYTTGGSILSGANWVDDVEADSSGLWAATGTDTARIWRSTDNGATWQRRTNVPVSNVLSLLPTGENIYAATDNNGRVYVSYDTGATWLLTDTLSGAASTYSLLLSTTALPNKILAGTGNTNGYVFVSDVGVAPEFRVVDIVSPEGVVPRDTGVAPMAAIRNIGLRSGTGVASLRIHTVYSDSAETPTLHTGQTDTVNLPMWVPSDAAAYVTKCTTYVPGGLAGDKKKGMVSVSRGAGPEIHGRSPADGNNTDTLVINITGAGFEQGITARLSKSGQPDIVADTLHIQYVGPDEINATFDLTGAAGGVWDLEVRNPDGDTYCFHEGFTVVDYPGRVIPFGEWSSFGTNHGDSVELGVTVPSGTDDMFVLLKKSTIFSHHLTWDGSIRVIKDGSQVASATSASDYGLHIRAPAPGFYTLKIRNTDNSHDGQGQIRVSAALDNVQMDTWRTGYVLRGWGNDWCQFDVPSGDSVLYVQTEGFGIHSALDVYRDSLGSRTHHWHVDENYQLRCRVPNPAAGRYYVKYMDSDNIVGDTCQVRDYMIRASTDSGAPPPPAGLRVTGLSTYRGGTAGPVTVVVSGTGFDTEAVASLQRDTFPDVVTRHIVTDSNGRRLRATFDLSSATPGDWAFKVKNPNGDSAFASRSFTVVVGGSPDIWVDITGREVIRVGRWSTYLLRFGNSGAVDDLGRLIWVKVPEGFIYDVKLPVLEPAIDTVRPQTAVVYAIAAAGEASQVEVPMLPSSGRFTIDAGFVEHQPWPGDSDLCRKALPPPPCPSVGRFTIDAGSVERQPWPRDSKAYRKLTPPRPKPGEMVFRWWWWPGGGDPAHVGIYYEDEHGNGYVIDFDKPWGDYHRPHITPFDQWADGRYIGSAHPPGWTEEKGRLIAQYAYEIWRTGQVYQYWLFPDPSHPSVQNCFSFCRISYAKFGLAFDYNPQLWPIAAYWEWTSGGPNREPNDYWWPASSENHGEWDDCWTGLMPYINRTRSLSGRAVTSSTPEDKCGPVGFDYPTTPSDSMCRYVVPTQDFSYRVDFWDSESASAPVQEVFVRDTLSADLADSTLGFTSFGFLRWNVPLDGGQYFNTYVDMRPDDSLIVNVEGSYDPNSREVSWTFRSLDPITMEPPEDPMAGFLPPIDSTGYQIGWVNFTAKPKSGLPTGHAVTNQSYVKFDVGPWKPAPESAPYLNTIDAGTPTSSVRTLPETTTTGEFTVRWTGRDDSLGSGVHGYGVYFSRDNGPYQPWFPDTADTTATFVGANESRYRFYSAATDNVGWREAVPDSYDTRTVVTGIAPPVYLSPSDSSLLNDATPQFVWSATAGTYGHYTLQYSTDSTFGQCESILDLADTTYTMPDSLALGDSTWFWRVEATSRLGAPSGYRQAHWFLLDAVAPAVPSLLYPADDTITDDSTPRFGWTRTAGDSGRYMIQFAVDSLFDSLTDAALVMDTTYKVPQAYPLAETTHYWRVKATDKAGNSSGYQAHPFSVTITPLRAISGATRYYFTPYAAVDSSRMVLSGGRADTVMTDSAGLYLLADLPIRRDYTVKPEKVSAVREPAVSSYDAAMVLRHAVHIDTLDSLQFIAGDVSGDGSASAYDAALILRYAVGMIHHFPVGYRPSSDRSAEVRVGNGPSASSSPFPPPQWRANRREGAERSIACAEVNSLNRPVADTVDWAFRPPQRAYDSLSENQADQDYAGILYGDPSGNWPDSGAMAVLEGMATGASRSCFTLNLPERENADNPAPVPMQKFVPNAPVPTTLPLPRQSGVAGVVGVQSPGRTRGPVPATGGENMPAGTNSSSGIVFPIVVHGARGMVSADALVRYDAEHYVMRGIRTSEQTDGFLVAANDRDGNVRIAMAGTRKLDGDARILELVFERASGAAAQTPGLKLQASQKSGNGGAATTPEAVVSQQQAAGSSTSGAVSSEPEVDRGSQAVPAEFAVGAQPSAGNGRPLAEIVWLVLNEAASDAAGQTGEGAMGEEKKLPATFYLAPPKPNPFGNGTGISYGLPFASEVRLSVFDVAGKKVRTLVDGTQPAGRYALVWDGSDSKGRRLANGVYFIRMKAPTFRLQRKVTLLHR